MTLIADCGSSKTAWIFLEADGERHTEITGGINALLLTEDEIAERIAAELMPRLDGERRSPRRIFFYGAGCVSDEVCGTVERALRRNFAVEGDVEVSTDLLAAARAVCGRNAGIACILGTGSNSCLYDGEKIVDNVSPLGFILGDEGSGAVMGRKLVGDVLKRQLPPDICEDFHREFGLGRLDIIKKVYKEPMPNRFLASLSPFLLRHSGREEVRELILSSFGEFFRRNVALYPGAQSMKVNFVGSVAYYYRNLLEEAAESQGF